MVVGGFESALPGLIVIIAGSIVGIGVLGPLLLSPFPRLADVGDEFAIALGAILLYHLISEASDDSLEDVFHLCAEAGLVFTAPGHQARDQCFQSRFDEGFWEGDDGDFDETEDGADDLAVGGCEEEGECLDEIFQHGLG